MSLWLNAHPASDDPGAPLWSKLKKPESISYRMYRNIFIDAAERVSLSKPDDPTNFRKSSASTLASKGVSQAHLEKRYGWKRGNSEGNSVVSRRMILDEEALVCTAVASSFLPKRSLDKPSLSRGSRIS